jgi:hypothetical protein
LTDATSIDALEKIIEEEIICILLKINEFDVSQKMRHIKVFEI